MWQHPFICSVPHPPLTLSSRGVSPIPAWEGTVHLTHGLRSVHCYVLERVIERKRCCTNGDVVVLGGERGQHGHCR